MGARFLRGGLYVGAAHWFTYVINFAVTLMVARLLGPESFGLYVFVAAVNEFISIVNGLAIAPALVQSREESESRYGWTTSSIASPTSSSSALREI